MCSVAWTITNLERKVRLLHVDKFLAAVWIQVYQLLIWQAQFHRLIIIIIIIIIITIKLNQLQSAVAYKNLHHATCANRIRNECFKKLVHNIALGMCNLPTNFGVSGTLHSWLMGQHLSDAQCDIATLTFNLEGHGTCRWHGSSFSITVPSYQVRSSQAFPFGRYDAGV